MPLGWLREDTTGSLETHLDAIVDAIRQWRAGVPTIEGIFLDETPSGWNPADEHAVTALLDACWEVLPPGRTGHPRLVLNPGTTVGPDWQERWPEVLWCTFEGPASAFLRARRPPGPGAGQVALVHSCRSSAERDAVLHRAAEAGWEWAHATTGRQPDPWRTVVRGGLGRLSP